MKTLYAILLALALLVGAGFTYFARAADADGDFLAPITVNRADGTVTLRIQDFMRIIEINHAIADELERLRARSGCT